MISRPTLWSRLCHLDRIGVWVCLVTILLSTPVGAESLVSEQAVIQPRADRIPSEHYMSSTPPRLSPLRRQALEQALQRSHPPMPPLGKADTTAPKAALNTESSIAPPHAAPSPLAVAANSTQVYDPAWEDFMSTTAEPSVAQTPNRVFFTANWFAAESTNGGTSWTFIDPSLGPFPDPPSDFGFCCDQVTIYDPVYNAIYWLQQYIKDTAGGSGTQRINVDMGANGTWDCSYDFTPAKYILGSDKWLDFPDFALSSGFLFHTTNVFSTTTDQFTNSVVARYPRAQIGACRTLNFSFISRTDSGSPRLIHGAGSTMYWATHNSTGSMRVWKWDDGSGTIQSNDRTVPSWPTASPYSCAGPDGRNMCGRSDGRVLAGYRTNGVIGFLWNASQGGSFPYPHVRVQKFRESDLVAIEQNQIWNSSYAWVYPSIGVNGSGDLGGTILVGGGTRHLSCAAFVTKGTNGGTFPNLDNTTIAQSTTGPGNNRAGDYLTTRPDTTNPNGFVGTCYSLVGGGLIGDARNRLVKFSEAGSGPFTLSITKAGNGTGTVTSVPNGIICGVTCNAQFNAGTTITLTASPAADSIFAGWNGGGCSGLGSCTVVLTANTSVTATFNPIPPPFTVTVTKGGAGDGTVTSTPNGINCGAQCTASFPAGTLVTLSATPAAGSVFGGWTGGCVAPIPTGPCTVSAATAVTVTAIFNPIPPAPFTVSVTKSGTGSGKVTSSPDGIDCGAVCSAQFTAGSTVTLTAVPDSNSVFAGWAGAGCSGTGVCSVTGPSSVIATFNSLPPPNSFTVSVVKDGNGAGTVSSSPAGINCGSTCSANFQSGTTVVLSATPAAGSAFAGWNGGGCTGTATCTVDSGTLVTATFTVSSPPPGGGDGGGGGCTLYPNGQHDALLPALLVALFAHAIWRAKRRS